MKSKRYIGGTSPHILFHAGKMADPVSMSRFVLFKAQLLP